MSLDQRIVIWWSWRWVWTKRQRVVGRVWSHCVGVLLKITESFLGYIIHADWIQLNLWKSYHCELLRRTKVMNLWMCSSMFKSLCNGYKATISPLRKTFIKPTPLHEVYLGRYSGKLQKKRIALLLSNISHRSNYKRIKLSQTSAGPCKASRAINWTGQVEESTYHYKILSQKVNIMFQEIKNIKENMILSAQVWASLTLVFLKIFIHIRVKTILNKPKNWSK